MRLIDQRLGGFAVDAGQRHRQRPLKPKALTILTRADADMGG